MSSYIKISAPSLYSFLDEVLSPYQLLGEVAEALKTHLVEANLCGMDSHGLQQIIGYVKSLQSGRINPQPQLRVNSERPTMIRIDGDRTPGQYAGQVAMDTALAAARQFGMAVVGVSNSNHFGMAGYYTRMAAEAGMIGFATSDTNGVDLAPYGGRKAKLGNNPISWGIPTGTPQPIILDMAAGTVSGGKVKHFGYQGLPIPLGWGLTEAGEPTQNPKQVAVNLPASYKGSGLAFVADLLCGPLLGTAAAMFKTKAIHDSANGTGHFFWVLDVEAWTNREEFEERVQSAIASLKQTPRLDVNQPIYYPGELEAITREERLLTGIPIPQALIDDLAVYFGEDSVSGLSG
ncbi:Ldh family oxidoreductase [Brasilonema bromeliae]|uniref:Ldh family oxidoreductase n=1 Tax=Brasilonema bromeliae SPC951 TaxID=385972 RepID=A0ABX1PFE1_9CYAN|nr:Ldh family oxidoreductase [Brasilonema bromeliae]NMG22477.1 Ldh family oxidoreductase [Brasilonema bromeliae SPC951]